MKCTCTLGDLQAAIAVARITLDKKQGSTFSNLYLEAKKAKGGADRLVLHSSDTTSRTLIRVEAMVEAPGCLIVDPIRLTSAMDHRELDETVSFAPSGGRMQMSMSNGRVLVSNARGYEGHFKASMDLFPHTAPPLFSISALNLKKLIERTGDFTYRGDGREAYQLLRIRSIPGGYEAFATNTEVGARSTVEDPLSPAAGGVEIEIPNHALESLNRLLSRNKLQTVRVILDGEDMRSSNNIYFRTDDVFYGTRASAAHLPDTVDAVFVLTNIETQIAVERSPLLASIQRSSPYCSTSRSGRLISLELNGSTMSLSAQDDNGEFHESLAVVRDDEKDLTATFPMSHFSEIFRKAGNDAVSMTFGRIGSYNRYVALIQDGATHGASYIVGAAS